MFLKSFNERTEEKTVDSEIKRESEIAFEGSLSVSRSTVSAIARGQTCACCLGLGLDIYTRVSSNVNG